jgi:outer membrane protein assembly factor BamB
MNSSGNGPGAAAMRVILGQWLRLGCFLVCGLSAQADPETATTNLWIFRLPPFVGQQCSFSTPAVAPDGTVYVGSFDGWFYAITPEGRQQWRFKTGQEIKSSPAVADDGTIYFGSRDRQLYALTPNGQCRWKFATGAWVDSSPAIALDGTVYFGSWDKNFYALKPDGSLKWKFNVGNVVDSSPAIAADGTIYFGAHDKKLYALDPAGNVRWAFATGAEITTSPAIGRDGHIYFGSTDGNLYRLKPDGAEVWHCRTGSGGDSSPVLAESGNIIIAVPHKIVFVSPAGEVIWTRGVDDWVDATPAVVRNAVICSNPWHQILGVGEDHFTELWRVYVTGNLTSSPVIGNHGEIYCCTDRAVEALQPPPLLLPPVQSPWPMFRADARHTGRARNVAAAP